MKLRDNAKAIALENAAMMQKIQNMWEAERREKERQAKGSPVHMLPSPASITSSANSTPAGKEDDQESKPAPPAARSQPPNHPHSGMQVIEPPPKTITVGLSYFEMGPRRSQGDSLAGAMESFASSQNIFTLPMLSKHFPRTYQRVVGTTLSPSDDHEPDAEDEEGELFWPGQFLTDSIAWVCLIGKAMVKEFGKEYGYRGLEGVILKEEGDHTIVSHCPDPVGVER